MSLLFLNKFFMRKILLTFAGIALLASCGVKNSETTTTGSLSTGTTTTGATVATTSGSLETIPLTAGQISGPAAETGSSVELFYILRENDQNGKIIDTNVQTGTTSQTLDSVIGSKKLVPGFEKALVGMKAGEVKSFAVSPEEGYGTGMTSTILSAAELAPEFTRTASVENISSKATQTIPLAEMSEEAKKLLTDKKAGDVVMDDPTAKVVLVSKTDKDATLEFHNVSSPFYPKDIAAGMEATQSGTTFKIEKIENNMATIHVVTSKNPFTKETYKVGSTGKYMMPDMMTGQAHEVEVKIVSIDGDKVTVEMPNQDPLANKTLYFQVKMSKVTPGIAPQADTTTKTSTGTGA